MGENSCKRCHQPWLNLQSTHTTQQQKKKQTNKQKKKPKQLNRKIGRRPKQTFLQRRHMDGQQANEKNAQFLISNY